MKTLIALSGVVLAASTAFGQATQSANLPLEYRANTAYNQGRYAVALPLMQELAGTLIDHPEKLGPLEEQIRVCKRGLIAASLQQPDTNLAPPATTEARTIHQKPKPGEVLDIAIKELGNFSYDADHGGNIPADVQALSGTTIRTQGYMIPIDQAENIGEFALVPSLFSCCSGRPPQVQHTIIVHLPKGKVVSYDSDDLQVEGTLKVREAKDAGFIVSIFEMDAISVTPAAK